MKRKTICKFPSSKGDVPVVYTEGVLEQYFCYYLELDPSVIQYQCQPLGYHYYFDDKKLSYTPDFKVLVDSDNGRVEVYYEIKQRKFIDDDFEVEFQAKRWPVNNAGMDLILVDDHFIMQQPKLSNLKRIYASRRRGLPADKMVSAVKEVFRDNSSLTADNLMKMLNITIGEVYQLIYYKEIIVDFEEEFGPEMTLWGK
ncbi:Tn7 transposase TnsA N-terminal domain-containing protein [Rheinheimera soli]|uniref:Tn7 transposase TnsA N-terminal domain-containing protein n=1 Tax=Rheinheimera soli TaxID=443616 RepID=UPI001E54D82D|nr:Tn7 transposase TnsA N-terminal domain-containing protein [Rheinheimera soli]